MHNLFDKIGAMADKTLDELGLGEPSSLRVNFPEASRGIPDVEPAPARSDLDAVHDTCEYIKNVMGNFNARIDSLGPEASAKIQELNSHLAGILIREEPNIADKIPKLKQERKSTIYKLHKSEPSRTDVKLKRASLSRKLCISIDTSDDDIIAEQKKTGAYSKYLKKSSKSKCEKPPRVVTSDSSVSSNCESPQSESDSGEDAVSCSLEADFEEIPPSSGVKAQNSTGKSFSTAAGFPVSTAHILQALQRLDNRIIPKPEKFDVASGQSLEQFFSIFESYASETFRGDSSLWVGELGRFLVGEMRSAYDALRVSGDSYRALRRKLLKWNADSKEVHVTAVKSRFSRASKLPEESFRLYAARLEKLFRLAYPRRGIENSKTLRQKYFDTVPKSFQKHLKTARSIALTMGHLEMTWSNVLALASRQDAEEELCLYSGGSPKPKMDQSAAVGLSDTKKPRSGSSEYCDKEWTACCHSTSLSGPGVSRFHRALPTGTSGPFYTDCNSSFVPKPNSPRQTEQRTCSYCKRVGHLRKDCRRFMSLCLMCGAPDHQIRDCPQRRSELAPVSSSKNAVPRVTSTYSAKTSHYDHLGSSVARGGGAPQPLRSQNFLRGTGRGMREHPSKSWKAGANVENTLNW